MLTFQLPFSSFDKAKATNVYAIRVARAGTTGGTTTTPSPILCKRRFREFVELREQLMKDGNIKALALPHLPSKLFSTDVESRRPRLEAWLNAVVNVCGAAAGGPTQPLPEILLKFLNVPSMTVLLEHRDGELAVTKKHHVPRTRTSSSTNATKTGIRFALSDPTLLVVYALSFMLMGGFVYLVKRAQTSKDDSSFGIVLLAALPFMSIMLLCAAAVRILGRPPAMHEVVMFTPDEGTEKDESAASTSTSTSKDHSILPHELPLLESLRERLSDFTDLQVSHDFDEAWIKSNKAVVTEWNGGETAAREALGDLTKRTFIWQQYGLVDRRLVQFIRSNHDNLVLAEAEAREAFTSRVALRMDWIHEYFTPPTWLTDYASCPVLQKYIHNRDGRLAHFWLKDRDGCLAVFNRAGPIKSLAIAEKLNYNDPVLVQSLLWYIELLRLDFDAHHDATQGDCPAVVTLFSDMTGFALSEQIGSGTVLRIAQKYVPILSKAYNGVLKRVIVFNAPWFVGMLYAIIKPFVPAHILACISIHGTLDAEKHIKPFIEAKWVPKSYGGELMGEDGEDETCRDRIPPVGPWLADKGERFLQRD